MPTRVVDASVGASTGAVAGLVVASSWLCRAPEGVRHLCLPFGAPSAGNEVSEEGTVHRELQRVALLTQAAVMGEALKE